MKKIAIFSVALYLFLATSGQAAVVGEWYFDGNANDSSGNGNNGTEYGDATYTTGGGGVCDEALSLDGAGDYVNFGAGVTGLIAGDYSLKAWISPASLSAGRHAALSFSYMELGQDADTIYFWQAYGNSWGLGYQYTSGSVLTMGEWTHVVAVHHEDTGIDIYVDGSYIGSDNTKSGADGTVKIFGNTHAGVWYYLPPAGAGGAWFDGEIDEVRIYDYALTALEIENLAVSCAGATFEKIKLTGPDDIGISQDIPTEYTFEINYDGPAALIVDTVPAEFEVTTPSSLPELDIMSTSSKGKKKSSTIITWFVPAGFSTQTFTIKTRESSGKGHKKKGDPAPKVYKPISCGPLELNNGAMAYKLDESGAPVIVDGEMVPIEGLEGGSGPLSPVTAVCGNMPCTPQNLVVSLSAPTTLSLDWDDVCGGFDVVYNIYRDGEKIAEGVDVSQYNDIGLTPNTTYCYTIEASYSSGPYVGIDSGRSEPPVCGNMPEL
jgi:hypothetical protein